MTIGAFLPHHLRHQIADGGVHISGEGLGGRRSHVAAGGGERMVVAVLQGLQSVGLAAH